jgi:hypothetical protein
MTDGRKNTEKEGHVKGRTERWEKNSLQAEEEEKK